MSLNNVFDKKSKLKGTEKDLIAALAQQTKVILTGYNESNWDHSRLCFRSVPLTEKQMPPFVVDDDIDAIALEKK